MEDTFNNHYISLVEKSSEMKPVNVAILNVLSDNDKITNIIKIQIQPYENDHSVKEIFGKTTVPYSFKFHSVTQCHIATLLKLIVIKPQA